MPSITNHGNSNQNYRDTNSHTLGWPVPKKKNTKQVLGMMTRYWNLWALLVNVKWYLTTLENGMVAPQNIKNRITISSSHSTFGIYWKDLKSGSQRDTCTLTFTAALFTTDKTWKQLKCPSKNEQIIKIWHTHTKEYSTLTKEYSTLKKEILTYDMTWMKLKDIILRELI